MTSTPPHAPARQGPTEKIRLPILDGLRGLAALLVVGFHLFDIDKVNPINRGYLAVDFFFMLSGFVIGYAYDDRWGKLTLGTFVKRRIIRLQPMVVIGTLIGAACFYFSGSPELFPGVDKTSVGALILATVLGSLLIPTTPGMDIRGWRENYPLNGAAWSLFFEYIANAAYALWLRKARTRTLTILAVIFGALLTYAIVTTEKGTASFGWELAPDHQLRGLARLFFPFITGLLLFRLGKTIRLKHGLAVSAVLLTATFTLPRVGPENMPWINGLLDSALIIFALPVILMIGAGGKSPGKFGVKACEFLGELSYPLYLVHFPFMYIFFSWQMNTQPSAEMKTLVGTGIFVGSLILAYLSLRFIDAPVRKLLSKLTR